MINRYLSFIKMTSFLHCESNCLWSFHRCCRLQISFFPIVASFSEWPVPLSQHFGIFFSYCGVFNNKTVHILSHHLSGCDGERNAAPFRASSSNTIVFISLIGLFSAFLAVGMCAWYYADIMQMVCWHGGKTSMQLHEPVFCAGQDDFDANISEWDTLFLLKNILSARKSSSCNLPDWWLGSWRLSCS